MKNPIPKTHELKTDPQIFDASATGAKTFELRFDDRGYAEGDILKLRRTEHTGAEMKAGAPLVYSPVEPLHRLVTHILKGPIYGLAEGWVILSTTVYIPEFELKWFIANIVRIPTLMNCPIRVAIQAFDRQHAIERLYKLYSSDVYGSHNRDNCNMSGGMAKEPTTDPDMLAGAIQHPLSP